MVTRLFKYIENFTAKTWNFLDKKSNTFHISAQNINCGEALEPPRLGGSNKYPQSMFLSRNKKNNVYLIFSGDIEMYLSLFCLLSVHLSYF